MTNQILAHPERGVTHLLAPTKPIEQKYIIPITNMRTAVAGRVTQ